MAKDTSIGSRATRLRPVVTPASVAPALGEWHGRGLCVGEDPDVFFPSHGDPGMGARRICSICPVRDDCLEYSTEADEDGIWGGLDQQERRRRKRRRQRREVVAQSKDNRAGDAA